MARSLLVFNFLLVLLFAGCAVKTQPAALFSGAPADVLRCGDALSATLGIAPLTDSRPEHERTGRKPKGVYLGVWNQRIGDYMTSDQDFTEPVPATMTRQFAHAIEKSNCFFEVKMLEDGLTAQPSPEEMLVAFSKSKTPYILTADIQHFYGTQFQNSRAVVIPALVVNAASVGDNVGAAQGFAEILVTLYDVRRGREIWRDKIETSSQSLVKGGYPQAASQALTEAAEKLSNRLYEQVRSLPEG